MSKKDTSSLHLLGVKQYLQDRTYLKSLSINDKRHIRKRSKDFKLVNGELYFIQKILCDNSALGEEPTEYEHLRRVLFTDTEKLRAVAEQHVEENEIHNGFEKTCKGVKMSYYWLKIPEYVKNTIRTCPGCSKTYNYKIPENDETHDSNTTTEKECEPEMYFMEEDDIEEMKTEENVENNISDQTVLHFWQCVEFSIFGPFDIKESKKTLYVCMGVDISSKWSEIQLLYDSSVQSLTQFIFHLICRYGLMKSIAVRNNIEFDVQQLCEDVNKLLNTDIMQAISSHLDPFWSEVEDELNSYISKYSDDWYKYLDIFLLPFRLTGEKSPAFLCNGREPVLPASINNGDESVTITIAKTIDLYKQILPQTSSSPFSPSSTTQLSFIPAQPPCSSQDFSDPSHTVHTLSTVCPQVKTAQHPSNTVTQNQSEAPDILSCGEANVLDSEDLQSEANSEISKTISTKSFDVSTRTTRLQASKTCKPEVLVPCSDPVINNSVSDRILSKKSDGKHTPISDSLGKDLNTSVEKSAENDGSDDNDEENDNDNEEDDNEEEDDDNEDSRNDDDYVPGRETPSSPVNSRRRSLRGIKQDWSCLLRKRKHSEVKGSPKKTDVEPEIIRRKSSKKREIQIKADSVFEENDIEISESSLESEEFYTGVKHYLEKQQRGSNSVKTNCKSLTNFRLENDHLYYRPSHKHREKQIVIPEEERLKLMAKAHVDDEGTHLCKRKVIDCLSVMDYYWKGITLDCEAFVRACPQCNNGDIRKSVDKSQIDDRDIEDSLKDDPTNIEITSDIIKAYLQHRKYPKNYDKKKKTTLRRKAASFMLKNDLLYYHNSNQPSEQPRLCLFTPEEKRKAIQEAHIVKKNGHSGLNKTHNRVKSKYYWVGQTNDVYHYISQCCLLTDKTKPDSKSHKLPVDVRIEKFKSFFTQGLFDDIVKKKGETSCDNRKPLPQNSEILKSAEQITDTPSSNSSIIDKDKTSATARLDTVSNVTQENRSHCTEAEKESNQDGINTTQKSSIQQEVGGSHQKNCESLNKGLGIPDNTNIRLETRSELHKKGSQTLENIVSGELDEVKHDVDMVPIKTEMVDIDDVGVNTIKTKASVKSKSSWIECSVCGEIFSGKIAYRLHLMKHNGEKSYFCDFCNKGFRTAKAKLLHHRKHTGEKPYLCNLCGRGFARKGGFKYHLKAHERGGGTRVDCDVCKRSFQSESRLNIHKKCKHPEVHPSFTCPHCAKVFAFKRSLKRHISSTHLMERNYVCDICNRAFARKEYLIKHIQNQHNKDDSMVQTHVKIETDLDVDNRPILQFIDAISLAHLAEKGEVTIQGDIILDESNIPVIQDNSTVVFSQDSVEYEVECLTSDQTFAGDDQAIQLLVQASLQSQQLQLQEQQQIQQQQHHFQIQHQDQNQIQELHQIQEHSEIHLQEIQPNSEHQHFTL